MEQHTGHAAGGQPTRTPATEDAYRRRGEALLRAWAAEGQPVSLEPAQWLAHRAPKLRASTLRQYRAALALILEERGEHAQAEAVRALPQPETRPRPAPKATSAKKARSVPADFEKALTRDLARGPGAKTHWGPRALMWLKATILTGLRPSEWEHARLERNWRAGEYEGPALLVRNAKATNGRAHGETRTLLLEQLDERDLTAVRLQALYVDPHHPDGLIDARGRPISFVRYYAAVRRTMQLAAKRHRRGGSGSVTLYSARHQFIANLKAAGYSLAEIAALAGHATDDTATEHYGRRRNGRRGGGLVRPVPDEVARIRAVMGSASLRPGKGPR